MKKILILSHTKSLLWIALKSKLEELFYNVVCDEINPTALNKYRSNIDSVILFSDTNVSECTEGLIYMKDMIVELGIPLFIVGGIDEIEYIHKYVSSNIITKEFVRPVNNNEVAKEIVEIMEKTEVVERKKVLVVDDSGVMLRNVKGWLENKYQVILANSGTMAIKYLATNHPDLVLLDYEMPVINGKQVLEMIRSESEFCSTPVIFLTGKDDKKSILEVMSFKPDGYLLKTLPPAEIVAYIDHFFEIKKAKEI